MPVERGPITIAYLEKRQGILTKGIARVNRAAETIGTPNYRTRTKAGRRPDLEYAGLSGADRITQLVRVGGIRQALVEKSIPRLEQLREDVIRQISERRQIDKLRGQLGKLAQLVEKGLLPKSELALAERHLAELQSPPAKAARQVRQARNLYFDPTEKDKVQGFVMPGGQTVNLRGPGKSKIMSITLGWVKEGNRFTYEDLSAAVYDGAKDPAHIHSVMNVLYETEADVTAQSDWYIDRKPVKVQRAGKMRAVVYCTWAEKVKEPSEEASKGSGTGTPPAPAGAEGQQAGAPLAAGPAQPQRPDTQGAAGEKGPKKLAIEERDENVATHAREIMAELERKGVLYSVNPFNVGGIRGKVGIITPTFVEANIAKGIIRKPEGATYTDWLSYKEICTIIYFHKYAQEFGIDKKYREDVEEIFRREIKRKLDDQQNRTTSK